MKTIVLAVAVVALAGCASTRSATVQDARASDLDASSSGLDLEKPSPDRAVAVQAHSGLGFRPVESSGIASVVSGPGEWRLTEQGWFWFRAGATTEPRDRFGRPLPLPSTRR